MSAMGSYQQPPPPRRRPGVVLAVVLALVLGLGGGYLLRYGTSTTSPAPASAAAGSVTPAPTTTPAPTAGGCASVADVGARILTQLRAAAAAIGHLDPSKLETVLNQVQQLQAQLAPAVQACRGEVTTTPIPTAPPPPTR